MMQFVCAAATCLSLPDEQSACAVFDLPIPFCRHSIEQVTQVMRMYRMRKFMFQCCMVRGGMHEFSSSIWAENSAKAVCVSTDTTLSGFER